MARLISGKLNGMDFSDPIDISVQGKLDETGVDASSIAVLSFPNEISAEIKTAIHEEYENNLIIESDGLSLEVSDPWHCGRSAMDRILQDLTHLILLLSYFRTLHELLS